MQNLLRRSPSGPTILSANSPLSLPLPHSTFTSLGLCGAAAAAKIMSSSTAYLRYPHPLHLPRNPFSASSAAHSLGLLRMAPSGCRPITCSIDNTAPFRAWVGFKESKYGSMGAPYRAWFSTCAGNPDNGGGDVSPDNDGENVRRVQRRQRSGAAVAGNPDLLTIPGVGQRNLRKLVEKGFEGVAQLKKLYKDKQSFEKDSC